MKRIGMVMLIALVALVMGCDLGILPAGTSSSSSTYSMYLRNEYADSIFSIHYKINDGSWVTEHNDERAGYYGIVSIDFSASRGDSIVIKVKATSLGQERIFTSDPIEVSGDINMVYDYDFATASFVIRM